MTNTNTRPVVKATATKTIAPVKVTTTKVVPATKTIAPVKVAATKVVHATTEQVNTLVEMLRKQNERIDALETQSAIYTDVFDRFERIIVSLQTAQLAQVAHVVPATVAPAPKAGKVATVPETIEVESFDKVLAQTAEYVRENSSDDFFNDKIIPQTANDFRVYLKTAQNKTFKIARTAANLSLIDAVNMLETAVNG